MEETEKNLSRREFLSWSVMGGALAAAYGLLAVFAGRFVYPQKRGPRVRDLFVTTRGNIEPGHPLSWTAPNGQKVLIYDAGEELLALSNVCPHLGCKVHWEPGNQRFLCPCHQGTFDRNGTATGGPPKAEGKNLQQYALLLKGEAVYLRWEEPV